VHHDVKVEVGSESNVAVYGKVVIDEEAPSGKVQACKHIRNRWRARSYGVCLLS